MATQARRWRPAGADRTLHPRVWDSRAQRRLVAALIFNGLANVFAFLQLETLVPRYILPAVATLLLFGNLGLWRLFGRRGILIAIHVLIVGMFVVLWHPRYGQRLPEPLSTFLTRPPAVGAWKYESDLRFLHVIHQIEWAAEAVRKDARERGEEPAIATQWPMTVSYGVADIGVVDKPMNSVRADSWSEVDPLRTPYVVFICPVSLFSGAPPSDRFDWENVAIHKRGEITAEIWYVRVKGNL